MSGLVIGSFGEQTRHTPFLNAAFGDNYHFRTNNSVRLTANEQSWRWEQSDLLSDIGSGGTAQLTQACEGKRFASTRTTQTPRRSSARLGPRLLRYD